MIGEWDKPIDNYRTVGWMRFDQRDPRQYLYQEWWQHYVYGESHPASRVMAFESQRDDYYDPF
jgi:hypothetical protein